MTDSPARQADRLATAVFFRYWAAVALGGGVLLSVVDAFLLERRRTYFTGGFLSVDHLTGAGEIGAFLAVSVLVDAAVVGAVAALVMWICGRSGVRATTTAVAALVAGAGPLLTANVVSYGIAGYLGDLFDLSLALELSGGSVVEMLSVASSHLLLPGGVIVGAALAAGGLVWLTSRYGKRDRPLACPPRMLWLPLLCLLVGLAAATIASASSDALENGLLRKPSGKVLAYTANVLTDFDGDGYGIAGRVTDPDLFNAAIYPYAVDIPGNGIDENGVGGDLPAGTPPYVEPPLPAAPWARRPDVVLIVLESFRADLVGGRFDGRPVTPVIDAVAARGVSSSRAYSHNGYTAPSRYHLFSGSLAGVGDGRTLVDDFNANGYLTAYFSGQDESFGSRNLDAGFERAQVRYDARVDRDRRYSTFTTAGSLAVPLGVVLERVGEFLDDRGGAPEPLFLYVNFHDTHFPYTHHQIETLLSPVRLARSAIARRERDALWATYVNTAANVDRAVGLVLDAVAQARGTPPAVIVTADHGESLFEEDFLGHGYALNEVQTRIPLVVAGLPLTVEEPFGQRDLRAALDAALRKPADAAPVPDVRDVPGREVFQYLGSISRPRQVAFLRREGRAIYDFRRQRVQLASGPWQRPEDLAPADRAEFLRLIHEWERMVLARHLQVSP